MEYLKTIPYIDVDRAVAAGGSYGGYMMNWINGNPLGRKVGTSRSLPDSPGCPFCNSPLQLSRTYTEATHKIQFKAIVSHDSVFSTESMTLMTDESDGIADWKGPAFAWSNHEMLRKWNPARPDLLANWRHAPPTLVVHSDNDYRCPITDGIAVFKTLQFLGVPSRFLNFPDENHFVTKPENSREWHRVVFDWINKYSGVAAEREAAAAVAPEGEEAEGAPVAEEEPVPEPEAGPALL